jgi:hypothetical protein
MSSMLYLQMETLFAPVSLWGALPSRGDCSPLGWILVRLVGCISLDISQECQLEFAAVDAMFALRTIYLLIYPYAGC